MASSCGRGSATTCACCSWVIDRCEGRAAAKETPIGFLPRPEDIDLSRACAERGALQQLMDIDPAAWHAEIDDIGKYLEGYGARTPPTSCARSTEQVKSALG